MPDLSSEEIGTVPGTRPIFLSGVYRSGTTFLTAVVNSLPNVAAALSTVKYLRFCQPHHHNLDDDTSFDALLAEIHARIHKRWDLTLDSPEVRRLIGKEKRTHARVYDAVMHALLLSDGSVATRWAEKLAVQWRDIPLFLQMFPEGQVIHVFRDPRDVTASYKKMTYEPWPTYLDAALNCKAAMIEVPELVSKYGAGRILMLRAEDLAHDLAGTMQRMCEFLGEPLDPASSQLDQFANIRGEDWRTNTSFPEDTANYARAHSRWKEHLDSEDLFLIELLCQPEMAAQGYSGSAQDLSRLEATKLSRILSDPWFGERLNSYLVHGRPQAGYRTDPYETEMRIVFGGAQATA